MTALPNATLAAPLSRRAAKRKRIESLNDELAQNSRTAMQGRHRAESLASRSAHAQAVADESKLLMRTYNAPLGIARQIDAGGDAKALMAAEQDRIAANRTKYHQNMLARLEAGRSGQAAPGAPLSRGPAPAATPGAPGITQDQVRGATASRIAGLDEYPGFVGTEEAGARLRIAEDRLANPANSAAQQINREGLVDAGLSRGGLVLDPSNPAMTHTQARAMGLKYSYAPAAPLSRQPEAAPAGPTLDERIAFHREKLGLGAPASAASAAPAPTPAFASTQQPTTGLGRQPLNRPTTATPMPSTASTGVPQAMETPLARAPMAPATATPGAAPVPQTPLSRTYPVSSIPTRQYVPATEQAVAQLRAAQGQIAEARGMNMTRGEMLAQREAANRQAQVAEASRKLPNYRPYDEALGLEDKKTDRVTLQETGKGSRQKELFEHQTTLAEMEGKNRKEIAEINARANQAGVKFGDTPQGRAAIAGFDGYTQAFRAASQKNPFLYDEDGKITLTGEAWLQMNAAKADLDEAANQFTATDTAGSPIPPAPGQTAPAVTPQVPPQVPTGSGGQPQGPSQKSIDHLLANPQTAAQFDAKFGAGASAKYLNQPR